MSGHRRPRPARFRVARQHDGNAWRPRHRTRDDSKSDTDQTTVPEQYQNGMIFVCTRQTKHEVMRRRLFGAPDNERYLRNMQQLKKDTSALFLFNVGDRMLYGVYKPTCHARRNIERNAWRQQFPVQIRFEIAHEFQPVPESAFSEHIRGLLNGIKRCLNRQEVNEILTVYRNRAQPALPRHQAVNPPNQQASFTVPRAQFDALQRELERYKKANKQQQEKISSLMSKLQRQSAEEAEQADEKKEDNDDQIASKLCGGDVQSLFRGENWVIPVLQVLDVKYEANGNAEPRCSVVLSDSHWYTRGMMASHCAHLHQKQLTQFCFIRLKEFRIDDNRGKEICVVLQCEVLQQGSHTIGRPGPWVSLVNAGYKPHMERHVNKHRAAGVMALNNALNGNEMHHGAWQQEGI